MEDNNESIQQKLQPKTEITYNNNKCDQDKFGVWDHDATMTHNPRIIYDEKTDTTYELSIQDYERKKRDILNQSQNQKK